MTLQLFVITNDLLQLKKMLWSYQLSQKEARVDHLHPPSLIDHLHSAFLNLSPYLHLLLVLHLPPHQLFLFSSQL